ncbi:MAG: thioredoxin-disulfide reductase [Sphingobacterium sp.]|jgi:thioredoxin reductase (NADPH)|nr:thioredoxin-disulfide reductase [Sphingobacterium sp.]
MKTTKCLIIGSGPAGYTAAIYASRAGLSPILYTGIQVGGQLTETTDVDNFPGYPKGIQGPSLMEDLRKQAERFGTEIINEEIVQVDLNDRPFMLKAGSGTQVSADTVIIATGASAKWLGLPNEAKYNGRGVSACATCDGFFHKGKEVIVVGGGDTALEEAMFLSNIVQKVYLVVRKEKFGASRIMQDRIKGKDNITVLFNTELIDVIGNDQGVNAGKLYDNNMNISSILNVAGIFIAIGHTPNTDLFKNDITLDERGYIRTVPGTTKTNVPGVFACGDVQDNEYRQAITAAGSGCMAAIDSERYLSSRIQKNGIICLEPALELSMSVTKNGASCVTDTTLFT